VVVILDYNQAVNLVVWRALLAEKEITTAVSDISLKLQ
jgi:hypothetical protein